MSRVRDVSEQAPACGGEALVAAFRQSHSIRSGLRETSRLRRLLAMAAAGLAPRSFVQAVITGHNGKHLDMQLTAADAA